MKSTKLRRQIAFEAARLMYQRQESEYYQAKMKAARRICQGWVKPADLPSNAEIRDEIQGFARLYEGEQRTANLRDMRLEALRMMRILRRFRLFGGFSNHWTERPKSGHCFLKSANYTVLTISLEESFLIDLRNQR